MDSITLPQIWTVAAVLAGFQVTAFTWRLNRELDMQGETTWLTWADLLVAGSFLTLVCGVFAVPLFSPSTNTLTVAKLFGLALAIYAGSFFVLVGHYNLCGDWGVRYTWDGERCPRGRCTRQETATLTVVVALVLAYGVWLVVNWVRL